MPTNIPDLRPFDATAVRATAALIVQVSAEDLDRPTPCDGWLLRDLLAHMTAQHHEFAAAAGGPRVTPDADVPAAETVPAYVSAAEAVLAAFAPDDVLDRDFTLDGFGAVPARMAISFHFVDYVVHGWDVARSLDVAWELPPDVLAAALPIAEAVPDDDATRRRPGAVFKPRRPAPASDDALGRIVALLGRTPDWKSPA